MWMVAYSTYPQGWEEEMLKIKEVNQDAFKYLIVIPPRLVKYSLLMDIVFII